MSRPAPKITCLFCSEVSVAAFLNTPAGRALAGDLLVECSPHPALAFALNLETPANYPGVAGLLGDVDVATLAHATDKLPAPIVLAAGSPAAMPALRAALALLRRSDERLDAVTLLVPVGHARELGAALAIADRFAIAWDAAAFPHEELVDFARWLAAERMLTAENFLGVHSYSGTPVTQAHADRIAALLAPLTARQPAIRSATLTVA